MAKRGPQLLKGRQEHKEGPPDADTGEGLPLLQGQREAGEGMGQLQVSLRLGGGWGGGMGRSLASWFHFLGRTGGK